MHSIHGAAVTQILNRTWRLLATASCFAVFGIGGIILSCLIFPIIFLLVSNSEVRASIVRRVVHYGFKSFVWLMTFTGVLTLEIVNQDKIRRRNSILVIANHPTLIDVVLLISVLPDVNCVVKSALWVNPFTMGVMRCAGYINNKDPVKIVEDCVDWLKSGGSLVIFPEGSRTRLVGGWRLKRGAGNIAARAGRNITPVIITCKPLTLNKECSWYNVPHSKPHFRMVIHEDIDVAPIVKGVDHYALASRRITDFLEKFFDQEVVINE